MTTIEPGSRVRERMTRWSPVTGRVVDWRDDGRMVVWWELDGETVARGTHDPANLEPAT